MPSCDVAPNTFGNDVAASGAVAPAAPPKMDSEQKKHPPSEPEMKKKRLELWFHLAQHHSNLAFF